MKVLSTKKEILPITIYENWLAQVSDNSKSSYARIVPQFLEMTLRTNVESITDDMLESLTPTDVYERYVVKLKTQGFKDATIANYISVVRSFVRELEDNRVFQDIDYRYLRETALSAKKLKDDAVNRGMMSFNDYDTFYDWLLNKDWSKRYSEKGKQYSTVLKFMFVTGIRINATFSRVHWTDIKPRFDEYGNFGYIVSAIDKGDKLTEKPITEEFYEEVKSLFYTGNDEELVFGELSKQNFTRLTNEFSKETGREMTPHSIRVGAGTRLYHLTKDLIKVQKFLNHTDPKVTLRYIRTAQDISDSGSFILSSNLTIDEIHDISYDDIVGILTNRPELAYTVIADAKKGGIL